MASLVLTLKETLRYRGAIGQWSWVLHRLTGLGVVLFLFLHVIDTAWAVFAPESYVEAIATYQSPLFTIGEFFLVACVVYHALNGLRIVMMDFRPDLWKHQQQAAYYVLGGTVLILIPFFAKMGLDAANHYTSDPFVLPISEVILAQLPFLGFFVIGAIAAVVIAFIQNSMADGGAGAVQIGGTGSSIEKFWWSFMRVSGILIVPLVFGHLAMMHVLQGVFDLTASNYTIIGTSTGSLAAVGDVLGNGINDSGTSVEFVAERWGFLWGGVAIWKVYDIALLALVVTHGFNGLRYILTDYTMDNPLLRRTVTNLCLIGGLALLLVGAAALFSSIDQDAIDLAIEATRAMTGE
ncbi:MAG: succinate dehydrogenase, cytochrome b556 subunit [Anaerolineae bacterium]|nr:succinate dehydrogenase, cytochrome b556 subunit [Anaerolineae bacterium]MDQ7035890.1 succinate dehydrogenase, cytochrome b556 subunit [Anaerolineae bacterium]